MRSVAEAELPERVAAPRVPATMSHIRTDFQLQSAYGCRRGGGGGGGGGVQAVVAEEGEGGGAAHPQRRDVELGGLGEGETGGEGLRGYECGGAGFIAKILVV